MKTEPKYALLVINELNGERGYTHYLVREIPEDSTIDEMITEACKEHVGFDEDSEPVNEDDQNPYYYSSTGEIAAKAGMSREITKEEFDVLNKFI